MNSWGEAKMIRTIFLIIIIIFILGILALIMLGLIFGFATFWAAVGTAIYHFFKKDDVDKKKNKNFRLDQGKEVK